MHDRAPAPRQHWQGGALRHLPRRVDGRVRRVRAAQSAHRQGVGRQPADRDIHLRARGAGTCEAERGAQHGLREERAAVE